MLRSTGDDYGCPSLSHHPRSRSTVVTPAKFFSVIGCFDPGGETQQPSRFTCDRGLKAWLVSLLVLRHVASPSGLYVVMRQRHDLAEPIDCPHAPRVRSAAASPLVWGAAPDTACGWGVTAPWRVAQACVNSAPKNTIRAE
jgi:hypothetical protein